jgi:DmsE family decaheme c-type cytochrome
LSCINCHQIHPKPYDPNPGGKDRGLAKRQVFAATKDSNPLLRADESTLCAECHKPEIADFRKNSHHPIPEGRMNCSDCHSIHPTTADRLKVKTLKDKCVTCHADIAGPFAFEHDPVAGWIGGGCNECHNPHGSQNPQLLKSFSRGMCAQCHTAQGGANHHPGQTCWTSGCHVAVHGSNHDPRLLSK